MVRRTFILALAAGLLHVGSDCPLHASTPNVDYPRDTVHIEHPVSIWLTITAGGVIPVFTNRPGMFALAASLSMMPSPLRKEIYTLRALHAEEFCIFGCDDRERVSEYALLFGLADRGEVGYVAVSGGPGWATGQKSGDGTFSRIGLAVDAQLFARLADWFGLGICGFGDFGSGSSYLGLLIGFQVGGLR